MVLGDRLARVLLGRQLMVERRPSPAGDDVAEAARIPALVDVVVPREDEVHVVIAEQIVDVGPKELGVVAVRACGVGRMVDDGDAPPEVGLRIGLLELGLQPRALGPRRPALKGVEEKEPHGPPAKGPVEA